MARECARSAAGVPKLLSEPRSPWQASRTASRALVDSNHAAETYSATRYSCALSNQFGPTIAARGHTGRSGQRLGFASSRVSSTSIAARTAPV